MNQAVFRVTPICSVDLVRADSILAVGDHPYGGEPPVQADRRILKDRPDPNGDPGAGGQVELVEDGCYVVGDGVFGDPRRYPTGSSPSLSRGGMGRMVRRIGDIIVYVHDGIDHDGLYRLAESQAGYFTAREALAVGMDRSTLRYHARPGGRYERVRRGIYRLRHFPAGSHEHVVAAWLPLRDAGGVVSHESALELYGLSDGVPDAVHISLGRAKRGQRPRRGVRIHSLRRPPGALERREVHGVPVTTPERSIVDSLDAGAQPEQVEAAICQALSRGLTTRRRLRETASGRSARVRGFVEGVLGKE